MTTSGVRRDVLFEIAISGDDVARAMLDETRARYPAAFRAALYYEASAIFAESQKRVPVDTGRLRASGGVSPPTMFMGESTVSIYYGTDYALAVHQAHRTKSGFLLDPFLEALPGMSGRLAKKTEELAAGGIGLGFVDAGQRSALQAIRTGAAGMSHRRRGGRRKGPKRKIRP